MHRNNSFPLSLYGCQTSLFVLGLIGTICDFAKGEPITFRFDATITHALAGNPFQLPFTYEVGDAISGKLTFDPNTGMSTGDNTLRSDQFHQLEFDVNGTVFGTSSYSIRVFDNDLIIADDPDISNGAVVDTMIVECSASSSQMCTPELFTLPGGDSFSINARLSLTGDNSIYNLATISADPVVWNSFDFKRLLNLSFGNETGGSMSLIATVHEFTSLPEPSSLPVIIASAIAYFVTPRFRSKAKPKKKAKGIIDA